MVTFYKLGSVYYIASGCGRYGDYTVNGVSVTDGLAVNFVPEKVEKHLSSHVLTGYKNIDTGDTITPAEYDKRNKELRTKYNDDDDVWENIDAEYEWKKFNSLWAAVYDTTPRVENVPFEVVSLDYDVTEFPPYTTACRVVANPNKNVHEKLYTMFTYTPNVLALVKSIGEEQGFTFVEDKPFFNVQLKGMEFTCSDRAQSPKNVKGYFPKNFDNVKSVLLGTLEECQERHKKNVELITEVFKEEKAKFDETPVKDLPSLGDLVGTLTDLRVSLDKVDSKVVTQHNLVRAKTLLNKAISSCMTSGIPSK